MNRKGTEAEISVSDIKFYVPVGYYTHEHAFPVEVIINFKIFVFFPEGHKVSDINDTISYEPFVEAVTEVMAEPLPLIDQIAMKIKEKFDSLTNNFNTGVEISGFEVTVLKKEILVPGPASSPVAKIALKWQIGD